MNIDLKDLFSDKNVVQLTIIGLIAALMIVGVVLGIRNLNAQNAVVEQEQQTLTTNENRVAYLQRLAAAEEQTRETAAYYKTVLPESASQAELFSSIQKFSEDYDLDILQVGLGEVQERATVSYTPVNMTFEGSYENMLKMLTAFCYDTRIVLLDTVQINSAEKIVTTTVTAAVFFQSASQQ